MFLYLLFFGALLCVGILQVRGDGPADTTSVSPDRVRKDYAVLLKRLPLLGYDGAEENSDFFVDSVIKLREQGAKLTDLICLYRDNELEHAHAIIDPLLRKLPEQREEVPEKETVLEAAQRSLTSQRSQCERLLEEDGLSDKEKLAASVVIEELLLKAAFRRFSDPRLTYKLQCAFQFCEIMSAIHEIDGVDEIGECREILRLDLASMKNSISNRREEELVKWALGVSIILTPDSKTSDLSWAWDFFYGRFQNPDLDADKGDAAGWLLRCISVKQGIIGTLKNGKAGLRLFCLALNGRDSLSADERSVMEWVLSECERERANDGHESYESARVARDIKTICDILELERLIWGGKRVVAGTTWKYEHREERPKGSGNWVEGRTMDIIQAG